MKSFQTTFMRSIFFKYTTSLFFIFLTIHSFSQETLTVIGNAKGSPSELKMMQLQSILKGEKQRWSDGTKVIIALMKTNTPTGSITSKRVFNMSGDQLNKYWLALVFQGKADAPTFFNSMNELETFVAQTPGAIGIIGQSPTVAQKTIIVDGKKSL
jgi:ABC-type phosphate transport system substrate-binding protein